MRYLLIATLLSSCASMHERCMDRLQSFKNMDGAQQTAIYNTCIEQESITARNRKPLFKMATPEPSQSTNCHSTCFGGSCSTSCH